MSGWLILFMVVFSPWAFGTTEPWSIGIMNALGYALGALLVMKWTLRVWGNWQPERWDPSEPRVLFLTRALALLTVLILAYCLTGAWNARAFYDPATWTFTFHDPISWLPHSYDARSSWNAFWTYTALALFFWAARDWLLGRSPGEEDEADAARKLLSERLRILLWVLSLNGALVALQGLLQQIEGGGKLLWISKPVVNPAAETQFGPYAYRANASQFFNLIWPVTLGFWWTLRRAAERKKRKRGQANLLLSCALLMAAAPLISNSRGGALIAAGSLVLVAVILIAAERRVPLRIRFGMAPFFVLVLVLGWLVGWPTLSKRMENLGDAFVLREEIFDRGRMIADEYRWFGTGAGTLDSVFQLYRESPDEYWPAQLHNDWLETRITFGRLGSFLIGLAFLAVLARWFFPGGIAAPRVFAWLTWLALAGCLVHARFDFPFQIYSIVFVFLLLCSILSCVSRR